MSEPTPQPAPAPQLTPVPSPVRNTWKYAILLILLLAGPVTGYSFDVRSQTPLPAPIDEVKALREDVVRLTGTQKLAPKYTDGDFVADAPKEASKVEKIIGSAFESSTSL